MRAWSIGLIGLLSPLLCAGLWSWGTYHLVWREDFSTCPEAFRMGPPSCPVQGMVSFSRTRRGLYTAIFHVCGHLWRHRAEYTRMLRASYCLPADNLRATCHQVASNLYKPLPKQPGKSEGFDSCDRPSNLTQIGFKSSIFQPVWPWNLTDDLEKTTGHLFSTTSSFVHHFKAMGEFKLELQSGNSQFGSKSVIFCPVWSWNLMDDLEK